MQPSCGHRAAKKTTMRAFVPARDAQRLVEFDEVEEPLAGEGDVVVEVEAFSVNRGDLYQIGDAQPGWRPGQDVAGTVLTTTAEWPSVGTRVAGLPLWGGWAERVALPATRVAALPDDLSTRKAAALPLAATTALGLLRAAGPLFGCRVLATGAAGGLGHFLVQMAANAGAEVTAVTSSAERGERLLNLGAAEVVREVEEAQGPFEVVFESVGGVTLPAAVQATAPGGLVLWYGQASLEPSSFDLRALIPCADVRVQVFNYYHSAAFRDTDLATVVRLVAEGRLHIEVGREEPWERTPEILADLRDRRIVGNAVLTVT